MFASFATKALFAVAVATPAMADIGVEYRSTTVSYADLDLSTPSGVARLNGRIKFAARQVCGIIDGVNLRQMLSVNRCRDDAIASANRTTVTLIAAAQRGEAYASLNGGGVTVVGR